MEKTDCKIRHINKSDLKDIATLYTLFWNDKANLTKMEQTFSILSQNPNYIFLGAEDNGKIIGTIQGVVCDELYGECIPFLVMENFVVAEDYRGKGIGRQLLNEPERIGKEKQCSQIIFITETARKETVRFYEKVGFDAASHKGFKKSLR